MPETVRVGMVGAGGIARQRHLPGFKQIDGVEIVAVVNRTRASSERVAKEYGIPRVHDTWVDLVADPDIDAVVIGTWPYTHMPITLAALEAGKHVLTEGRMAMNAAQARVMLAAARAHPKLVTMIVPGPFTLAVDPMVHHLLAEGYLGRLQAVEMRVSSGFVNPDAPLDFRTNRDLSGVNMMLLGPWYEAVMRWVGSATAVTARTRIAVPYRHDPETGHMKAIQVPDHVEAIADLPGGALMHVHFSAVTGLGPPPEVWLYGSEGTLRYELVGTRLSGGRRGDKALSEIAIPDEKRSGWVVEQEFINAIRGAGRVERTTFEDGVRYMDFTEAVILSSQQSRTVPLPLELGP
jgi:predicted dehydrogenase